MDYRVTPANGRVAAKFLKGKVNSESFLESEKITIGPPTNERYSYAMSKLISEQYIFNEISIFIADVCFFLYIIKYLLNKYDIVQLYSECLFLDKDNQISFFKQKYDWVHWIENSQNFELSKKMMS